jgi:hypothetical protein
VSLEVQAKVSSCDVAVLESRTEARNEEQDDKRTWNKVMHFVGCGEKMES